MVALLQTSLKLSLHMHLVMDFLLLLSIGVMLLIKLNISKIPQIRTNPYPWELGLNVLPSMTYTHHLLLIVFYRHQISISYDNPPDPHASYCRRSFSIRRFKSF